MLSFNRIYDIAMFTYLIAFGHFSSEWLIFRSATFNVGLLGPVVVSSKLQQQPQSCKYLMPFYLIASSLIWMFNQYDYYVKV
jgi:hypothetical protein